MLKRYIYLIIILILFYGRVYAEEPIPTFNMPLIPVRVPVVDFDSRRYFVLSATPSYQDVSEKGGMTAFKITAKNIMDKCNY